MAHMTTLGAHLPLPQNRETREAEQSALRLFECIPPRTLNWPSSFDTRCSRQSNWAESLHLSLYFRVSEVTLEKRTHQGQGGRVLVRPRLRQARHLQTTLARSDVQRRDSNLRRAPPRQCPTPAPHKGPAHVRPYELKKHWSRKTRRARTCRAVEFFLGGGGS